MILLRPPYFYFRWLEISVTEIGKAAQISLIFIPSKLKTLLDQMIRSSTFVTSDHPVLHDLSLLRTTIIKTMKSKDNKYQTYLVAISMALFIKVHLISVRCIGTVMHIN